MQKRILADFFQIHLHGIRCVVLKFGLDALFLLNLAHFLVILKHARGFNHVDICGLEPFVERFQALDVFLDIGKGVENFRLRHKAAMFAFFNQAQNRALAQSALF